jgi:hypothetical protein
MRRAVLGLVVTLAVLPAAAGAAETQRGFYFGGFELPGTKAEQNRAYDVEERADRVVHAAHRRCGWQEPHATTIAPPVDAGLLGAVALLRRPAGPQDVPATRDPVWAATHTYAGAARYAMTLPGTEPVRLAPLLDGPYFTAPPKRCDALMAARIRQITPPGAVRTGALTVARKMGPILRAAARMRPAPSLALIVGEPTTDGNDWPTDSDGAPLSATAMQVTTLSDFTARGLLLTSQATETTSRVVGAVPDGVARIELTFRGRRRVAASVLDNVFTLTVAGGVDETSFATAQRWFAADGRRIPAAAPHG